MKKLLTASILVIGTVSAAYAADLRPALKAAPPPPMVAPPPSWTGYYIGGNIGYAWGDDPKTTTGTAALGGTLNPGTATLHPNGGFSGLQSGYNWQIAPTWLVGFENDFQYGKIKGSAGCLVTCGVQNFPFITYQSFSVTDRLNWFGTVRGRIGYVLSSWMVYLTAGGANADVKIIATEPPAGIASESKLRWGWTAGVGVEAARIHSFTLKAEYLYVDFSNTGYFNPPPPGFINRAGGVSLHDHILRIGLNHKFPGYDVGY